MIVPGPPAAVTLPREVLAQLARGTEWLGTWWPAAVLAALAAVLVVVAVRRERRPGSGRRSWPAIVGAVITLLLASGFAGFATNAAARAGVEQATAPTTLTRTR